MPRYLAIFSGVVVAIQTLAMPVAIGWAAQDEIPNEVRALEGTYTGSWTLFGIDKDGKVVRNASWTDTVEAKGSKIKDRRAFVSTTTTMVFEGGRIPPIKMQGREGYALNQDGSLGSYFIEMNARTHRMVKLGENVWSYTASAGADELGRLGFPPNASGQHVLVKIVTTERGVETHRISRVTMVNWTVGDGKERTLSFLSLKGHHKRQQ